MKKILLLLLPLLFSCTETIQKDPVIRNIEAFGTTIQVSIYDTSATPVTINRGLAEFEEYIHRISYLADADSGLLARINRSGSEWILPDDTLAAMIKKGIQFSKRSNGLFDITIRPVLELYNFGGEAEIPDSTRLSAALKEVNYRTLKWDGKKLYKDRQKLDLSGIRRGFALTRGADILRRQGIRDFLINGEGLVEFDWRHEDIPATIYIRHPRDRGKYFGKIRISKNAGLGTAADYQTMVTAGDRKIHELISAKTGRPYWGTVSVSVLTLNALLADFYSRYLYLLGPSAAKLLVSETQNLEAVIIWEKNGALKHWVSEGLKDKFELIKPE